MPDSRIRQDNMQIPQKLRLLVLLALVQLGLGSAPALAEGWNMTVKSLQLNGAEVTQVRLDIIPVGSTSAISQEVRVGQAFPVGTVIAVPARTRLDLISSNQNEVHLMPGSRLRLHAGSAKGEAVGLDDGEGFFDIRHALNFFNVRHKSFQAVVKGTRYSIKVVPQKEIFFSVTEGVVRVEREGKLRIDDSEKESTVVVADELKAGESKRYRLDIDEYLVRFKNFGDAEAYYRNKLEQDRASGNPDRIELGLNQLGIALRTIGKARESIAVDEECLQRATNRHPDRFAPDIAGILNNLGIAYSRTGNPEDRQRAIDAFGQALKIEYQLYSDGIHPQIAATLSNLGTVYHEALGAGNLQRAIRAYTDSLGILRKLSTQDLRQEKAAVLDNLGILHADLEGADNQVQAIRFHQESLTLRRELFPNGLHPDIATSQTNLGNIYNQLSGEANLRKAIAYYNDSLSLRRKLYPGMAHPEIAASLNNLGAAYHKQGTTAGLHKAAQAHTEALAILKRLHPDGKHEDIAAALGNLASDLIELNDDKALQQAIGYYEDSLKIRRQLVAGAPSPAVADSLNSLGTAYLKLGDDENLDRARHCFEDSLAIIRQSYPDGLRQEAAFALINLGDIHFAQGDHDSLLLAAQQQEEALALLRKLYPDGQREEIAKLLSNLGASYASLGSAQNLAKAFTHLDDSLALFRHLYPEGLHRELASVLNNHACIGLLVGKDPALALRDSHEALKIAPDIIALHTCEAHALLFMGKEAEARAIYVKYRNAQIYPQQTFRESVLDDFQKFREAGISHPGMDRIETLYRGKH